MTFKDKIDSFTDTFVSLREKSLYINNLIEFANKIDNDVVFPGKNEVVVKDINTIEFKNVFFKYKGIDEYILNNINLEISNKERICLVGLNGAGKTTLIKLLLGLYAPEKGEILFNNINIMELDIIQYRKLFSISFQDFCKYSLTVGENILFKNIESTDEENINKALSEVNLKDKIYSFENNIYEYLTRYYDSNGKELSGGEWQKLSLARAFARETNFLIMDEPSSNLDAIAEDELFSLIDNLSTNKMVLFVSHRLSSAKKSDRIIFIKNGTITENGSHSELIKLNGEYANMFSKQSSKYI